MTAIISDTHPEVERLHLELIRKAPVCRRLHMVASLVRTTYQLSWQGICERYPEESEEVRLRRFLRLLYDEETLIEKVTEMVALWEARASSRKDDDETT